MSIALPWPAPGSPNCVVHRQELGEVHCDGCHRSFCRQCVVSRYAFNDSTVWLCRTCAGVRRTLRGESAPVAWPQVARRVAMGTALVLLLLLGLFEATGVVQPWLDARLPPLAQSHAALGQWLLARQAIGAAAIEAVLQRPNRGPLVETMLAPLPQPTVPAAGAAPNLRFTPALVTRDAGQLVAQGEVHNDTDRRVATVLITVTFKDAATQVVDRAQTQLMALAAGQHAAWQVRVPDRGSIVAAETTAQVYW